MFKKNASVAYFPIGRFVSTTDGTEATTGTPTGTYSKDGTEGTLSGTIAYKSTAKEWGITGLTATELNGDVIGLNFTLAGAVPTHYTIRTTTKLVSELVDAPAVATDGSLQVTLKSGTHTGAVIPTVTTVGTLGTQAKLDVNAEVDTALADYDAPTNAEMVARTLATADYATATNLATLAGYVDTEVAAIKAKTDGLPSDPADASDIAALFATVNVTLATIAGYIDTEIGAIKAKTDNLPASPAAVSNIPTAAQIRAEMDAFSTKLAQLAGAFTGSTSVFTAASLVNAPAGEGGGGGGATADEIAAAVWDKAAVNTTTHGEIAVATASVLCGNLTENAGHTASSFADINDPATPRVTSVNTSTTRTVTVN